MPAHTGSTIPEFTLGKPVLGPSAVPLGLLSLWAARSLFHVNYTKHLALLIKRSGVFSFSGNPGVMFLGDAQKGSKWLLAKLACVQWGKISVLLLQ